MADYSHVRQVHEGHKSPGPCYYDVIEFCTGEGKTGAGNKMPLSVLMKLLCLRYVNTHANTRCTSWSQWKAVKSEVTPWGISGKIQLNCSYDWMQFNQWVSAYIYNYHHFSSFFSANRPIKHFWVEIQRFSLSRYVYLRPFGWVNTSNLSEGSTKNW